MLLFETRIWHRSEMSSIHHTSHCCQARLTNEGSKAHQHVIAFIFPIFPPLQFEHGPFVTSRTVGIHRTSHMQRRDTPSNSQCSPLCTDALPFQCSSHISAKRYVI